LAGVLAPVIERVRRELPVGAPSQT